MIKRIFLLSLFLVILQGQHHAPMYFTLTSTNIPLEEGTAYIAEFPTITYRCVTFNNRCVFVVDYDIYKLTNGCIVYPESDKQHYFGVYWKEITIDTPQPRQRSVGRKH